MFPPTYPTDAADVWSIGVILYVLLAGYLPFDENTMVALFQKIKNADFEYPDWFSAEAKDLLDKTLVPDPQKRIKLNEMKAHPWMQHADSGPTPSHPDHSAATAGAPAVVNPDGGSTTPRDHGSNATAAAPAPAPAAHNEDKHHKHHKHHEDKHAETAASAPAASSATSSEVSATPPQPPSKVEEKAGAAATAAPANGHANRTAPVEQVSKPEPASSSSSSGAAVPDAITETKKAAEPSPIQDKAAGGGGGCCIVS